MSGDSSCADHNIAWRTRARLAYDFVPGGVSVRGDDNINYQGIVSVPNPQADFSHPICKKAGVDEAVTFERALMLQAAASKLDRYRSMILSSHRPNKRHPWACRQTPDESEP
ncbi:MAG TPA: hypothetical protein VJT80_22705 [Steroidobacteraceae bacterium]|nr:hypothetical protein [Steroidobacteraceae bacterium]